jgi:hypothetical protein
MKTIICILICLSFFSCYEEENPLIMGYHVVDIIVETDAENCTIDYIEDIRGNHSKVTVSESIFDYRYYFDNRISEIDVYVNAVISTGTFVDVKIYINGVLEYSGTDTSSVEILDHFMF